MKSSAVHPQECPDAFAGLTVEGLYDHLKGSLPYEETRSYLVKVMDRMALYEGWR